MGTPAEALGGLSSHVNRKGNDQGLLKHILTWSALDIMNDGFLRRKVKIIPKQFESLNNYFTSFHWPLLEEVRAQIKQSLEDVGEAPCVRLIHVKEYLQPNKRSESEFFMRMKIRILQDNGEQFTIKPKDLLRLSSNLTGTPFEGLGCSRQWSLFAFVENFELGGAVLTILVSKCHAKDAYQDLMDEKEAWYVQKLLSLSTACRIWQALNPTDMRKPIFAIMRGLLEYPSDQNSTKKEDTPCVQAFKHIVARYCSSACHLNESQTNAVVSSVCDVKSGFNPGVRIIQGPPGTGKTSTVLTLLSVAASTNMKCLVACPTNAAVAEVALRFLEMLENPGKFQFGEFCKFDRHFDIKNSASITTVCKILKKNDIILVGNEEKLPLQGELNEIYLPTRVVLIQMTNNQWREVASSLLNFIESIESTYEAWKTREDADSIKHTSLLQFARSNLEKLTKNLIEHSMILDQELPVDHAEGFLKTAKLTQDLLQHICEPAVSEQGFSKWFARNEWRVKLLKQLQKHLQAKQGPLSSRESIERLCMKHSSLVFCTVATSGRNCIGFAAPFDCLVIDEAAQLVEAETAIAACLPGLNHAILFGDHQQLPATVISKVAADCGYGRSLFERMTSLEHPCHLLNTQYRMHPTISLFPNSRFYRGCLCNGKNVTSPSYRLHEHLLYGPYAFIDVKDGAEERHHGSKSKRNSVEAAVVLALVKMLSEACKINGTHNLSVGIVTPYSSQRDHLRRCLDRQAIEISVNSVDGFQGQEKDVIIISTVRANYGGDIGFLKDHRRLNVAMTRARYCLWIVGCGKTLGSSQHTIWKDLLEDAMNRKLYKRAADDDQIRRAIISVKKDSNAYPDILKTDSALLTSMLWKVLFSPDFKNSLLQVTLTSKKDKIIAKICSLASGEHSSPHKMDCIPLTGKTKGLIEVDIVEDLYLIWSIDIKEDVQTTQILKIWDIADGPNLSQRIKHLQGECNTYSDQYMKKCKVRWLSRDKKLTIPATWDKKFDVVQAQGVALHQPCQKNSKTLFEISANPCVSKSPISMKLAATSLDIDEEHAASSFISSGKVPAKKEPIKQTLATPSPPSLSLLEHRCIIDNQMHPSWGTIPANKGLTKQNSATSSSPLDSCSQCQITGCQRVTPKLLKGYVQDSGNTDVTATANMNKANPIDMLGIFAKLIHRFCSPSGN